MKKIILLLAVVIILIGIITNVFLWQKGNEQVEQLEPVQKEKISEPNEFLQLQGEIKKPEIRYPVPDIQVQSEVIEEEVIEPEEKEEPLPELDESDDIIKEIFNSLFENQQFTELFLFNAFVRHFVVTIDNMTSQKLPQRFTFTKKPAGKFMVQKMDNDNALLDPENYDRYTPFVSFVDVLDNRKLVSVYVRYYPLFQKAYEDLGYPDRYFNDRLIEVIDHLLETPDVQGTVKLLQPKVFYTFADPDLEALTAGQKILIRIGSDNAVKVKAKLRVLRQELISLAVRD